MKLIAKVVEDIDEADGQDAGAIEFRLRYRGEGIAGIGFRCPCGCGNEGYLPVRAPEMERTQRPEWEWDGNTVAPTLSPSVFNTGMPCKWHGYLRNGEWVLV